MTEQSLSTTIPNLIAIANASNWADKSTFPANNIEIENWLTYIKSAHPDQYVRFQSRLIKDDVARRDETLAEILAAYFIGSMWKYEISTWEPLGNNGTKGEFSFRIYQGFKTTDVFCEVASPGWEGSLIEQGVSRDNPRIASRTKYVSSEAISDGNAEIRATIAKKYSKLPADQPTIIIIVPDLHLPVSLEPSGIENALFYKAPPLPMRPINAIGVFTNCDNQNLSSLAILSCFKNLNGSIKYNWLFYTNPFSINPYPEYFFHKEKIIIERQERASSE